MILEWTSSFTAYMSVIVSKHPNRAAELLEYLSLIRYAAYNAAFTTDTKDTKCCGWRTGQHLGARSALLKVLTKSKSARYWSAPKENRIHETHVMQSKEPGGVSLIGQKKQ